MITARLEPVVGPRGWDRHRRRRLRVRSTDAWDGTVDGGRDGPAGTGGPHGMVSVGSIGSVGSTGRCRRAQACLNGPGGGERRASKHSAVHPQAGVDPATEEDFERQRLVEKRRHERTRDGGEEAVDGLDGGRFG